MARSKVARNVKRMARLLALRAIDHGFVVAWRVGGHRGARWFAEFTRPQLDRMMRANLRDYQREAFGQ